MNPVVSLWVVRRCERGKGLTNVNLVADTPAPKQRALQWVKPDLLGILTFVARPSIRGDIPRRKEQPLDRRCHNNGAKAPFFESMRKASPSLFRSRGLRSEERRVGKSCRHDV